ncbi:uncharacterized protein FTOL_12347 [Fusarium torulosum]|uniref:Uncharacterized protein n=1 Tax=Fusarium torulosum TaxID=33205 RepID=A0AAE8SP52_9HYPO|nr:uncharacterized protein FTOL_12347 [Fusarium torulosum]
MGKFRLSSTKVQRQIQDTVLATQNEDASSGEGLSRNL